MTPLAEGAPPHDTLAHEVTEPPALRGSLNVSERLVDAPGSIVALALVQTAPPPMAWQNQGSLPVEVSVAPRGDSELAMTSWLGKAVPPLLVATIV